MPSAEDKFRALLTRIGVQPNRAVIANAFRQDAALAEVLPWIAENITDAHILDPELRRDYASLEGRLSLPLDLDEGDIMTDESLMLDGEEIKAVEEMESELEDEVRQKEREMASLQSLADQLSAQLQCTEQKGGRMTSSRLNYAYEEDRVFVGPLVRATEERAMQESRELTSQLNGFSSVMRDFLELTETHGAEMHFTQQHPQQYWQTSEDLASKLERMMHTVVASENQTVNRDHRLDQWVRYSDLSRQPWFHEIERLRQYRQVSELRRVEALLSKNKTELRCRFIKQAAEDFSQNPSVISQWKETSIEQVKAENKKLAAQKKALLKKVTTLLAEANRQVGLEALTEYIGRVCAEWNNLLIQKQEFSHHFCRQLDRNRVYTILAEIEKQRLEEKIQYIQNLQQTFRMATAISQQRIKRLEPQTRPRTDFIDPNDHYLQFLASFIKFCGERIEDSPQMTSSMASHVSEHKRQYSIAFSETPVRDDTAPGLTPVSKLIKEQQQGLDKRPLATPKRPTTPAELENSLRRLSVQDEPSPKTSLFRDTPVQDDNDGLIPFHEVTLQANRLLALPLASHQSLANLFPDILRPLLRSEAEALQGIYHRMFRSEDGTLVLSSPSLRSALEGVDQLIQELNQSSRAIKDAFKSRLAYLERQPEEAKARTHMAQFFTNILVQRHSKR